MKKNEKSGSTILESQKLLVDSSQRKVDFTGKPSRNFYFEM